MAAAAQTRLDRLVTLLENGSTPGLRATAARQLGQIAAVRVRGSSTSASASAPAALKPNDMDAMKSEDDKASTAAPAANTPKTYHGVEGDWEQAVFLLARVLPLLHAKAWDTRVAASQAIEAICAASGVWDPDANGKKEKRQIDAEMRERDATERTSLLGQSDDSLSFDTFSLSHILSTGKKLLSSAGNEYDLPANSSIEERLAHAKRDMQRLGLASMAGEDVDLGVDVEREILGTDTVSQAAPLASSGGATTLQVHSSSTESKPPLSLSPTPTPMEHTPSADDAVDLSKLSARERNQLKRKRKLEGKAVESSHGVSTPPEKTRAVDTNAGKAISSVPSIAVRTPSDLNLPPQTNSTSTSGPESSIDTTTAVTEGTIRSSPSIANGRRSSSDAAATASDAASLVPPAGHWPFAFICSLLLSDLFSPTWETRHGATLGLRELFKAQGASGGKRIATSLQALPEIKTEQDGNNLASESAGGEEEENAMRHRIWCDDCAIRLLCVLTLDRLGDFVFDHVIAPVRETAGQALSSLLRWMDTPSVAHVHNVLVGMVTQEFLVWQDVDDSKVKDDHRKAHLTLDQDFLAQKLPTRRGVSGYAWEVRHAGLLGLRYEASIRKDLLTTADGKHASQYLHDIVRLAIVCLRDDDDDVRGVAAASLLPIVQYVVDYLPEAIEALLHQVWKSLDHLKDDLSSSTGGVMDLLASLIEQPVVVAHLSSIVKCENETDIMQGNISELVPRLFPFFRHTIASVRLAVLNALSTFLTVPSLPKDWADDRVMRLLFQNLIIEERAGIREASETAWRQAVNVLVSQKTFTQTVQPHIATFFAILMTPLGTPIDFDLFYRAQSGATPGISHNVDKGMLAQDLSLVGVDAVIRGRLGAARAVGCIIVNWKRESDHEVFSKLLVSNLSSTSALQKCLACIVIQEFAEQSGISDGKIMEEGRSQLAVDIAPRLISILESPSPSTYAEMLVMLQRIHRQSQALYTAFGRDGKVKKEHIPTLPAHVDPLGQRQDAFTVDTAREVVSTGYDSLSARVTAKTRAVSQQGLEERRAKLIGDIGFYQSIKEKQDSQVAASAAAATIALRSLPAKLNPVIRSIMNSIKFEENTDLQRRSARAIASFIGLCVQPDARANPSDKIVKNLCAFICQDTTQTSVFDREKMHGHGILSLVENDTAGTSTSNARRGKAASSAYMNDDSGGLNDVNLSAEEREGKLIRRGAEFALQEIASRFGERLFEVVPTIWQSWTAALELTYDKKAGSGAKDADDESGQAILDCCTLLQVNMAHLHPALMSQMTPLLAALSKAVQSHFAVIRGAAAQTIAVMAEIITAPTLLQVVQTIVPLLGDATNVACRQGGIETISQIVRRLDVKLLPYVIVLIVPVLGRMSDGDESVRLVATNTFASLVKMIPLEAGLPDPVDFPDELMKKRVAEREFLSQLLDGNKVEQYTMPVKINAELRKYQKDGISWMAFLARFQLHGILCDDMGLGKTLQSICILASKHHEREQRYKATPSPDAQPLPSLIVCPPTLTSHWHHEIKQYSTNLRPLLYAGHPNERARLQSMIPSCDCVVASYDTVRNDISVLSKYDWLYCILDEGHMIKSAKAKTTKAVKMIRSQHRLILSGTPVQNNVLELWSLFDFLMPGFLGTEKYFNERYARPILASRDAKMNAKDHERASLALDALHKQVLPFLLRRMKEDVLSDLPPKIIQDIQCDMSDIQRQMYEDYLRGQKANNLENVLESEDNAEEKQHIFQTLQWLRKLVCHPLLVFDPTRQKHIEMQQALSKANRRMDDVSNAPKLLALKQLLQDCGIGTAPAGADDLAGDDVGIAQHRVLIFCQQRQMLDIIEKDLFQRAMPSVAYARLDGSVTSAEKRFAIVQRFNADPSIDVLLLTTAVGGLGLTLTGADTVIFVEHDWNPMKDMQAMDRAHRLGQKKVVNVYRLITRDTLEEKIMGLQRFKLNVAGNIINQENKGMDSMETEQILNLFDTSSASDADSNVSQDGNLSKKGISQKALLAGLESMEDLGDEYAEMQNWKG